MMENSIISRPVVIGAPFTCSYSRIAMARIEEDGLDRWRNRDGGEVEKKGQNWEGGGRAEIGLWRRYQDNCIGLWRGTKEEFNCFVKFIKEVDQDTQFTFKINWEENSIAFLDLWIMIDEEGMLQTTLYKAKCKKKHFSYHQAATSQQ